MIFLIGPAYGLEKNVNANFLLFLLHPHHYHHHHHLHHHHQHHHHSLSNYSAMRTIRSSV